MCFSSNASFIAGTVLMVTGAAAVKNTRRLEQIPFAFIPIIFSLQQICEGFLWLSFDKPAMLHLRNDFTFAFLIFAQVVWPVWIPLSVLLTEHKPGAKKILKGFLVVGALVSGYLFFCLVTFPVNSYVSERHIYYQTDYPHNDYRWFGGIFYISATVLPLLVSRQGIQMKTLGIAILLALLVTRIFITDQVISVWCYFAAVLSVIVLIIIRKQNNEIIRA